MITAVIPTYNRPQLLRRAIESVLDQRHDDIRIIVRDNASTDNTIELLRRMQSADNRIEFLTNNENIGPHENIRQGIRRVNTEYFSLLCDDDYLCPNFYIDAIKLLDMYPTAGFVVFNVGIVDINGKELFENGYKEDTATHLFFTPEDGIDAYLQGKIPTTLTGYVFRREIANSIDFGDLAEVGYGADIYFVWHAASRFNFIVANKLGGYYTSHSNSTSGMLVKPFDERFQYWWRNRMKIILSDEAVLNVVKEKIKAFYFKDARPRYKDVSYYLAQALKLISERLARSEYDELRYDLISIRSFLPFYITFMLHAFFIPLERRGYITRVVKTFRQVKKLRPRDNA